MKHWNVGNTTVRNPNRIKDGLRVFRDHFVGIAWNQQAQEQFYDLLVEKGIVDEGEAEQVPASRGIAGRKWTSCFKQLGLVKPWKRGGAVSLTDLGEALIEDQVLENDLFLRQFLKQHLPSPIESGAKYTGFDVYPFRLTLGVINALRENGLTGITKEEIGLFLITTLQNEDEAATVEQIINYRRSRDALTGKARKRQFYHEIKKQTIRDLYRIELEEKYSKLAELAEGYRFDLEFLESETADELLNHVVRLGKGSKTKRARYYRAKIIKSIKDRGPLEEQQGLLDEMYLGVKGATLNDYADTAVRYFAKTGLLSLSGEKLIFKETELSLIKQLVDEGYPDYVEDSYLGAFYNISSPFLPSDDELFLQSNIQTLAKLRDNLSREVGATPKQLSLLPTTTPELKRVEAEIKGDISSYKEIVFYRQQPEQVEDIIEYFEKIADYSLLGGDAYRPAYFEWTIWRVFLAIDAIRNPISQTRRFEIDEELNPIHHARGGVADMLFEYDDFVLAAEATLRTGPNQWSAEIESVPRHVTSEMQKYSNKPVYGVFVAPTIDPNTAQQFYGQTYWVGEQQVDVNIIPFTTTQIIEVARKFEQERFSTSMLKGLMETLVSLKTEARHGVDWRRAIDRFVSEWINTPIAS